MTIKKLISPTLISIIAVALSACGGSSDNGPAIEQTASAVGTPYVGITDEELGWRAEVPETQTAALRVTGEFDFATARRAKVTLVVPEAMNENADAAICTDYTATSDGYEVDYGSCVLQAPLVAGQLEEEFSLVNQHDSALSIVWFEDPDKAPLYQEFNF